MINYPEIQLLFLFLNSPYESDNALPVIPKTINWDIFTKYAIKHGLAALVYKKNSLLGIQNYLPESVIDLFKQQYYKTFARNTVFVENFKLIAEKAIQNNIDIILLKGISLVGNVYEDIALRSMSDIDILVHERDIPQITDILESLNYTTNPVIKSKSMEVANPIRHFHLPAYINHNTHVMVELHTRIHAENTFLDIDIAELWKNKIAVKEFKSNIGMLSPENLLEHLCTHIHEHFQYKNIRMAHFYDIMKVIEKYKNNELNWNKFLNDIIKFNIQSAVFPYLYLMQKYFNVIFPSEVCFYFKDLDKEVIEEKFKAILLIHPLNQKELAQIKNEEIKNIEGFGRKLIYVFHDFFPSKRFMINRYQIKYRNLFFIYYIKRWLTAVSRLFFILFFREKR